MNGPPIMKNKIKKKQWFMWTPSVGEVSTKPKSKHHCRQDIRQQWNISKPNPKPNPNPTTFIWRITICFI